MRLASAAALAAFAAVLSPGSALAKGEPGYRCAIDGPVPMIYPPMVHGRSCTPSGGAPAQGRADGPVKVVIGESVLAGGGQTWVCRFTDAVEGSGDGGIIVIGRDCALIDRSR
ncbi:hypothetical protein [Actinocorallia sp. A-T 12471]|uniref:hypothetical protein n=1 Tax=Actinocorallia sp. A-T 12471 TaxID=3089813 RepID=UPI0029CD8CE1|nr:hypothetical protein [Actinocorallia sp. A-T 12471]MDX6739284.1 hypothetical protein [Actinocorallia sp. A-T 12471]